MICSDNRAPTVAGAPTLELSEDVVVDDWGSTMTQENPVMINLNRPEKK